MATDLFDLQKQLDVRKDDLLDLVSKALKDAGLHGISIKSIHVDTTMRTPKCPPGTQAVWEAVRLPDGTVIFRFVCK